MNRNFITEKEPQLLLKNYLPILDLVHFKEKILICTKFPRAQIYRKSGCHRNPRSKRHKECEIVNEGSAQAQNFRAQYAPKNHKESDFLMFIQSCSP